jgi:phosphoglycerate dehydrogenase-like enzyme
MKIILPAQIRDMLAPQLPDGQPVAWIDADGNFDGDPRDGVAYFRWWTSRPILEKVLTLAPRLRWLHTPSAGVDHLLIPPVLERGITITNSAGVHAIPIAEFVLALLLAHVKRLAGYRAAQAEARWERGLEPAELYERTLLILGVGGIGQAIADRAAAFGMRVWGSRRSPRPMPGVERVVGMDGWRPLLPEADFVVVAAPLTPETRGMLDGSAFAAMRRTAYLVNIARGAIVDEAAMLEALRAGRIAGAALDTFEQEPLSPEHPLWALPNVLITPHTTSGSPRMRERQVALFSENLRRFRNNEPLLNVVDPAVGY